MPSPPYSSDMPARKDTKTEARNDVPTDATLWTQPTNQPTNRHNNRMMRARHSGTDEVKRGASDLAGLRLLDQGRRPELGAADDYQVLDLGNSCQGQPLP